MNNSYELTSGLEVDWPWNLHQASVARPSLLLCSSFSTVIMWVCVHSHACSKLFAGDVFILISWASYIYVIEVVKFSLCNIMGYHDGSSINIYSIPSILRWHSETTKALFAVYTIRPVKWFKNGKNERHNQWSKHVNWLHEIYDIIHFIWTDTSCFIIN